MSIQISKNCLSRHILSMFDTDNYRSVGETWWFLNNSRMDSKIISGYISKEYLNGHKSMSKFTKLIHKASKCAFCEQPNRSETKD